jgi:hypothetical protein
VWHLWAEAADYLSGIGNGRAAVFDKVGPTQLEPTQYTVDPTFKLRRGSPERGLTVGWGTIDPDSTAMGFEIQRFISASFGISG